MAFTKGRMKKGDCLGSWAKTTELEMTEKGVSTGVYEGSEGGRDETG